MEIDEANDSSEQAQAPQLLAIELRVLGAMMEKQLTTPDAYPLTINSIVTACNQKSSREPVTQYQQGEVVRTLNELAAKQFVRKEYGSRSEKYSQQFVNHLELGKKQQALLCVMMLRGPQTLSELHTRTQRMAVFASKEELEHCVERLCNRELPYAVRLAQQAGQRGDRIGHLFSGMPVAAIRTDDDPHDSAPSAGQSSQSSTHISDQEDRIELLELEVAGLNETMSNLKSEIGQMRQELGNLYRLTGHK